MDELARRLEDEPELAERHAAALDRFLLLGGGDLDARAGTVCAEVGLSAPLDAPLGALSGGEAARAQLAAVLLARFDVFLLDEPTNDLDFAGLDRLERFVRNLPGRSSSSHTTVTSSTARSSASSSWTSGRITRRSSPEAGPSTSKHALTRCAGKAEAYGAYEGAKARLEEQLRRMQQWEERGYGQGRKKKKTKDVKKSIGGRIERLGAVDKPYEPWELRLELAPQSRSGDVVVRLEGAVVERGSFRLGPLDLELSWADRLAIVGPNGSGQEPTLLDAILGRLAAGRRLRAGFRLRGRSSCHPPVRRSPSSGDSSSTQGPSCQCQLNHPRAISRPARHAARTAAATCSAMPPSLAQVG